MRAKLSRGLITGAMVVVLAATGTACGNGGDSSQQSKPATSYKPSCIVEELTGDGEKISVNICELKDKAPFTVELVLTREASISNQSETRFPAGTKVQVACSNMGSNQIGIIATPEQMGDTLRNIGTYYTTHGAKPLGMVNFRAFSSTDLTAAYKKFEAKYGTDDCTDPRVGLLTTVNDRRS